ncbi:MULTISPECIES: hypothetical protein [unclassified Phyllobacterium]|uniref:hypothetical protein n=1 Tax=Phyllobacterium TaxID=28100 RepID=UPI000DD979A1|nr:MULTISPECIES: hypothetical protein [unclassified Phyllobacterium]MBA8901640.1 hypothetical protein [Phyllobacterium sp. P30BS-XVII]UGX85026.1 hypothetical protein LLE53_011035 [Phyllobacterium sp. T1293]
MKIFWLTKWVTEILGPFRTDRSVPDEDAADHWRRDPLSHPALQAMGLDELADLPFDPRRLRSC